MDDNGGSDNGDGSDTSGHDNTGSGSQGEISTPYNHDQTSSHDNTGGHDNIITWRPSLDNAGASGPSPDKGLLQEGRDHYNKLNPVQQQALKCEAASIGKIPQVVKVAGLTLKITKGFTAGYAVGEDLNTHDYYNVGWDAAELLDMALPVPAVTCLILLDKITQEQADKMLGHPIQSSELNKVGPVKIPAPTGKPNPQGVAKSAG
jgi:hypothetical protein